MSSCTNYFLATLLCLFAASCYQTASLSLEEESLSVKHENWMAKHGINYESKEEKEKRFEIFKENLRRIESSNAGGGTYTLGINKFADLTNQEFIAKYASGFKPSSHGSPPSFFKYENITATPDSLDWRERNVVTPVQAQGPCGCCWAFSAVAALEGIAAIRTGRLTPISEQQILDCNSRREGCMGGYMVHAFEFVSQNGGVASDADYPYQTRQGACTAQIPSSLPVRITGYAVVPPNEEAALMAAVAAQPVSVGMDPRLMQFYRSGVLTGECGNVRTHAITAVGYGTSDDGTKFWLFKNSWGPDWGEQGFVRLQRDVVNKEGMCGITMDASYPIA